MNMQSIMAQAQRLQNEITKKQEEIYNTKFTGTSAWVTVTMNGNKKNLKYNIIYTGKIETDEDRDMLSDMISVATMDAYNQIEKEIDKKLGAYSKQLGGLM